MKIKRLLNLFLISALSLSMLPVSAETSEASETKRITLNVAQHKPVTVFPADNVDMASYPPSNMTDGFVINSFHAPLAGNVKNTISVDLLRRYNVNKIELYVRHNGEETVARKNFRILGSNDKDFADYDILGGIGETGDDNLFPNNGKYTVDLEGDRSYRYIAVERTADGWYLYAELKVYADVLITQVGEDVTAHSAAGSYEGFESMNAAKTVDGNIETLWLTDYVVGVNHDLTVDLKAEYPIEVVELGARSNYATCHLHNFAEIYGSTDVISDDEINQTTYLTKEQGYDKLGFIGSDETQDGIDNQFRAEEDGHYYFRETVVNERPYRYITLKRQGNAGSGGASSIAEVRAYVIRPEVQKFSISSQYLYVSFSDEMDFDNPDIVLETAGAVVASGAEKVDDYTCRLDISALDKNLPYTLKISGDVKNLKGVTLSEDYVQKLDTLNAISVGETAFYESMDGSGSQIDSLHNVTTVSAKTSIANGSESAFNAVMYMARYAADGKLSDISCTPAEVASGKNCELTAAMKLDTALDAEEYVKAFVWDAAGAPVAEPKAISGKLKNIYVSQGGDDNASGSYASPFATVERAKEEVKSYSPYMTEDINVYLREGIYTQSDTLAFDDSDSGKNGNYVNYMAFEDEDVTISGGVKVEGWKKFSDSIYMAEITDDEIDTVRELYVNGRKMVRARSEERIKPLEMYKGDDEITGYSGYYIDAAETKAFKNPSDIQLVYARGWSAFICNVEGMEDVGDGRILVTMQQPAFDMITTFIPNEETPDIPIDGTMYNIFWLSELNKFYMENAFELLDTPGEFYFDKTERILYYMPDGEIMESAEVYVPKLEKLVRVQGKNLGEKVENIRFSGITFTHATNKALENGLLGDQAQTQTLTAPPKASHQPDNIITGANIIVSAAENIEFSDNVFTGLAAVGVGMYDGANNVTLNGNVFYDIGDSAVTVGLPSDAYIDDITDGKNVALHKPVSCSKEEWGNFAAYANDGDANRGWNIIWDGNYTDEWWQVDLGKEYNIDRVVLKQRAGYGDVERKNFRVIGSNDPAFTDGGIVLAEHSGDEMYAETGDFTGYVDENIMPLRYIRVMKTKNEYFYLPEVEVISYDENYPNEEVCKNDVISNNYITRIGTYNSGAPGIQTYYTEKTDIAHNLIKEVPYSGICMGWGWINTPDSTTCKDNKIRNNHIEDYAQITFDAGGIYTLGQSPGTTITGNYIKDEINAYGAYYPDSGSSQYTVTDNVFENVDISYHIHSDKQTYLTVKNNYSTMPFYYDKGLNCEVDPPILFLPTEPPAEAQSIIAAAGLQDGYKGIVYKVGERARELTFDDMYGNVLEEDHPNILQIPGSVLVRTYLSYRIQEAESVISMAEGRYTDEAYDKLSEVLERARDMSKDHASMMAADRTEVIETRLELIAAMREFCEGLN